MKIEHLTFFLCLSPFGRRTAFMRTTPALCLIPLKRLPQLPYNPCKTI